MLHRIRSTPWRALAGAALTILAAAACSERAPTAPASAVAPLADAARDEPTFHFTKIEGPGATMTVAEGINAAGHVVGYYGTADGRLHGFVLRGGDFSTIDYPDAYYTDLRGIGPSGEMVGTFATEGEPAAAYHGFRLTVQGKFEPVHYSGHLYEILQRVLPDGTIVGCRHDQNTGASMKGIVIASGGSSEIGAYASMHNGATPDGSRIVGNYVNQAAANRSEAYIVSNGVFTPFMVPGSIMTAAWDINARGDIVGIFRNGAGFHGYVRTQAGYTTLDVPGASATRAFGTNARGDVVGSYVAGGKTYGFLATRLN